MANKIIQKARQIFTLKGVRIALLTLSLVVLLLVFHYLFFLSHVSPNVYINGKLASYLDAEGVGQLLTQNVLAESPESIKLTIDGEEFMVSKASIELSFALEQTTQSALQAKKHVHPVATFFLSPFSFARQDIDLTLSYNEQKLEELVAIIASSVDTPARQPALRKENGSLVVEKGQLGKSVDQEDLRHTILVAFSEVVASVSLTSKNTGAVIDDAQAQNLVERGEQLLGKSIELTSDNGSTLLADDRLVAMLSFPDFAPVEIEKAITEVSSKVNREPQNPVFVYENGRVLEFAPARDGLVVDNDALATVLTNAITELGSGDDVYLTRSIPVGKKSPDYQTAEVNDLGIQELLGVGSSTYYGSIASRIFNIGHAANQFKGVLVPPGEVFSFNSTIGEVSGLTGYKQAYIIQDGATVLGDGGGVCQISTTLFRAVMNAGLPIVERRSHSYRVAYYEQGAPVGLDATVYSPTTDFKFLNDTPAHILIQAYADTQNATLDFEIYGTADGRVATVSEPVVYSSSPPPEDLYIDDPTLPVGEIKQIDWKAWGAQVRFDYMVERGGEVIYEKTFYSNYRPWQAKFLRGTGNGS